MRRCHHCLRVLWGDAEVGATNLVELAIRRLRTKLEEDPSNPVRLVTIRGVGYKFVVNRT